MLSARRLDHDGEVVHVCDFDGRYFVLLSARALAPGQPLPLQLELDGERSLQLKSLGSKRQPDGSFQVKARASTLSREVREALLRRFGR